MSFMGLTVVEFLMSSLDVGPITNQVAGFHHNAISLDCCISVII